MVDMSYGNSGRFLSSDYYETRREAREETYTIDEWSDIDQTRYDLDTVDFDRKQMDREYITRATVETEGAAKGGKDTSDDVVDGQ